MPKLKFLRESVVAFEGKAYYVEVWQDIETGKVAIYDKETGNKISLGGRMGEEL